MKYIVAMLMVALAGECLSAGCLGDDCEHSRLVGIQFYVCDVTYAGTYGDIKANIYEYVKNEDGNYQHYYICTTKSLDVPGQYDFQRNSRQTYGEAYLGRCSGKVVSRKLPGPRVSIDRKGGNQVCISKVTLQFERDGNSCPNQSWMCESVYTWWGGEEMEGGNRWV